MPLTAVVLAAGAGTRLGEVGRRYSKPTVPVGGRPLIQWVVDMLRVAGVERLVVVGHPSDARLAQIVDGCSHSVLVHQAERRGIADALRCALPLLEVEDAYLACAGDSLYPTAEVKALIRHGNGNPGAAVIGALEMGPAATATRSAVRVEGERVIEIVEKPAPGTIPSGLVALPLYWLPRSFAPYCAGEIAATAETYITTALDRFREDGGTVLASRMSERLEVTNVDDLRRVDDTLTRSPNWLSI